MTDVSRETPVAPASAGDVFADEIDRARLFAEALCTDGVERGLLGPREIPRVWERHLLNCGVIAEGVPHGANVADVGSGAGLPGIAVAIRRPDLRITLIEPLLRRSTFLLETVELLGLAERVRVVRVRAEAFDEEDRFDVVTSRAVARLPKLLRWSAPLAVPGARLVAMKGRTAPDEVAESVRDVRRVSNEAAIVRTYGGDVLTEPATVVEISIDRPRGLEE